MIGGADNLKSNFNGCYDNALLLLRSIYSGNEVKNSRLFANRPPALKKYKNWCSVLKNHFYGIIKRTWTQKQEEKRCFWFLVIGIGTTFPNIKIWTVHNFAIPILRPRELSLCFASLRFRVRRLSKLPSSYLNTTCSLRCQEQPQ